jgi:hypothetical protein
MQDKLGSHWRWRLLFFVFWLALFLVGWLVSNQWSARVLVPGGYGPPVVMRVIHGDRERLQAYDWTTRKSWKLAEIPHLEKMREDGNAIRIVQGGKAVAWREWVTIHVMDIAPPHARRSYPISGLIQDWESLVGISRDEKMAVFCRDATHGGAIPAIPSNSLRVIDVLTGRDLSSGPRNSSMASIDSSDDYFSIRSPFAPASNDDPLVARWKLTPDGTWEMAGKGRQFVFPDKLLSIAESADGLLRMLDDEEGSPMDENVTQAIALAASPSGERFLVSDGPPVRLMLGDIATKKLQRLPWSCEVTGAAFLEDGTTLVVSDTWDDLRAIDTTTGQTVGGDFAGSRRKWTFVALAVSFGLVALSWALVALREKSTAWAMVDISLLVVAARCSTFVLEPFFYFHDVANRDPWEPSAYYSVQVSYYANAAATSGLLAWYWVHGRGSLVMRWGHGILWILGWAILIPLQTPTGDSLALVGIMTIASLIVAGFISAILLVTRGCGWTISDRPLTANPGRFDLITFLTVVAGVCVWLGLLRNSSSTAPTFSFSFDAVALRFLSYFAISIAIVAIFFSSTTWPVRAGLLSLMAVTVLIGSYAAVRHFASVIMPGPLLVAIEIGIYIGTLQAIVLPCLVLRARGWHWRRMAPKFASETTAAAA